MTDSDGDGKVTLEDYEQLVLDSLRKQGISLEWILLIGIKNTNFIPSITEMSSSITHNTLFDTRFPVFQSVIDFIWILIKTMLININDKWLKYILCSK